MDSGYVVASNGLLKRFTEEGIPGKRIWGYDWTHDIPCATYLYTFAVDKYIPLQFGDSLLPMQVWARAEDTVATRNSFKLLPRMVAAWEKYFGKYPFEKVGYVLTPTGSMEHETMISYYKRTTGDLRLATQQTGGWAISTIDSAGDVGRCTSMTLDPNRPTASKVAIARSDATYLMCA